jgi:hypothetical protein
MGDGIEQHTSTVQGESRAKALHLGYLSDIMKLVIFWNPGDDTFFSWKQSRVFFFQMHCI